MFLKKSNPPANAGGTGLIAGPGRSHMPQNNKARVPQLLSLRSRACEPQLLSPHHNYWSLRPLEPMHHNYWAQVLQLLKPAHLEPVFHNKRSHHSEKPSHSKEEQPPLTATRESLHAAMKSQHSQK